MNDILRRIARGSQWCVSPITGQDGRPSWSKIITAAVLGVYALGVPMPASVGVVAIAAAHGTKVLLAAITRKEGADAAE